MASVTKCDTCNNIVKHEESKYVEICSVTKYNKAANIICAREICTECYKKIAKILNIKLKEEK